MNKRIEKCLILLFLVIVAGACSPSKQADEIRILFIGNSYTYYNSTPELLKAFILEKFPEQVVETQLISAGGMTLARHWEEGAVEAIRSGEWDYVVLQEQSKLGMVVTIDNQTYFGQTEHFFDYARKFDAEIKKAGAKTVFLMTWSERNKPKEQAILTYAYTAIAKELDAIVAPVGLVWDKVRTKPEIDLYDYDGSHPSPAGSYLASVTLYATLFADDPVGLSESISGKGLSSSGEPSPDRQLLVALSPEEAQSIQEASWEVVDAMQKSSVYLDFEEPAPSYTLPVLPEGVAIEPKKLVGKWYGTSSYGFNYLGQILEIEEEEGKAKASLTFYSPHGRAQMVVEDAIIQNDQLVLSLFDPFRTRKSTVRISLNSGKMSGILESAGQFAMYKHLNFSREPVHNKIDLSALDFLMQSFELNSTKLGYVEAAIKHYEQYSQLIGESYKPEEFYLNAVGYNLLRDKKVNDALHTFELAMRYYPESVNTYDSYAEALLVAERRAEALAVYEKAYALAKNTGYENLAYIEENLNKLKNNSSVDLQGAAMPPPPPPQ